MGTDTRKRRPAQAVIVRDPAVVTKRILDAAQAEFMQVGYERANTNHIVAGFGGSKATLFRHFPSKQSLFEAVVRRIAGGWPDQVKWAQIVAEDPQEWLTVFGELALRWILREENIFVGRTVIAEGDSFPELRSIFASLASDPIQALVAARLREWTARGLLQSSRPESDALSFLDLVLSGPVSRKLYKLGELRTAGQMKSHVQHSVGIFIQGLKERRP